MLTFRTSTPSLNAYIIVHLQSSLLTGDWVHLRYYPGGESQGVSVNPISFSLPRPFRNTTTGVGLRSSRADVQTFVAQIDPFIHASVWTFNGALPPNADPVSLPAFVSADWPVDVEDWADFVQTALPPMETWRHQVEVVCMRRTWSDRAANSAKAPALELPLRIACEVELSAALSEGASYFSDEDVQHHIIRVEPWHNRERTPDADILVLSERAPGATLRLSQRQMRNLSTRTRLVVVLDPTPQSPFTVPAALRRDVAVAVIPLEHPTIIRDALHFFLEEIVHDNPLHEAMRRMRQLLQRTYTDPRPEQREWMSLARIYADPSTNQSLRLSSLIPQVAELVTQALPGSYTANFDKFASRVVKTIPADTLRALGAALSELDAVSSPFRNALQQEVDFDGERKGLVPFAAIAGTATRMQQSLQRITPQLTELLSRKGVVEAIEQQQARRLDAQLFHRIPDGMLTPVQAEHSLMPEAPLRLRVHIGQRSEGSLLIQEPPALDPLLPPLQQDEYHELQITVFPKDFRLESPNTHTVRLSRLGGTTPVEWDLKAPRPVEEPPKDFDASQPIVNTEGLGWIVGSYATLRVNVYFRNQLLQSFKLSAVVGGKNPSSDFPAIFLECDYSQTRRFGHLDKLGSRAISLALNADNETHTLMLAKDGREASVRWDTVQLATFTKAIRQNLYDAMAENGASRFAFDPANLSLLAQSLPHFESGVRALAGAGSRLYGKLFARKTHDPKLGEALTEIKHVDADVVQITATDPDYAFPWPILYDFDPPKTAADEARPICRGRLQNGAPCTCHTDASTYCLRGFWGLRLVVEQRFKAPEPRYDLPSRISPSPTSPVIGLVTAVSDEYIDNFGKTLEAATKLTVKAFSNTDRLLETFRNEAGRPSVIIFIGHHRNAGDELLPDHQLLSPASDPILRDADFRSLPEKWDLPRSLVFLLACGAGTARADTGPSLATALLEHGAAGVIATECTVFTPMVARIARDILTALAAQNGSAAKTTVGSAMRQTLFELALEGCPLGLAFTYHGIAEASLP